MSEIITSQVYEVLDKYGKSYSKDGVIENLDKWSRNKDWLVNLLRKHPNWNEDAMAVIFEVVESREIDNYAVEEHKNNVYRLCLDMNLQDNEHVRFGRALDCACRSYTKTLVDVERVSAIKEAVGINCSLGQKTSRVINAICTKFGIDKHPEYNARFAKLADSLNPLQVKKKALLSVHPCDFLEMSNRKNSWSSCHRLDGGEYHAGTLSYMNDECSLIFYTVDDEKKAEFYSAPKRTRQVFCFNDGILLQSRLYPKTEDRDTADTYRELVQRTLSECAEVPNLWTMRREHQSVSERVRTHDDSLHYRDYEYESNLPTVSLLKSAGVGVNEYIIVGSTAYCIDCGDELGSNNSLHCGDCDTESDYYTCCECESRYHEDDMHCINGDWYCNDCCGFCDSCEERTIGEITSAYNRRGSEISVCEECLSDHYIRCDECYEYCHQDTVEHIEAGIICNECLRSRFVECYGCDEHVRQDDTEELDGELYCMSCAEDVREEMKENANCTAWA